MPKRNKIGNVNVSHPEVTFTTFQYKHRAGNEYSNNKISNRELWPGRVKCPATG